MLLYLSDLAPCTVSKRENHKKGDEQLTGSAGTLWALTDHLSSVRDVVNSAGSNVKHRVYDAFGNVTSEIGTATFVFGFTGREFDAAKRSHSKRWRERNPGVEKGAPLDTLSVSLLC